jgi:protein-L-isoaspartate(D-aspartate) O-methyltransferase
MVDFATARRRMVDGQVRTNDVTDLRLQAAMFELPREKFVPADKAALAYLDLDLPVTPAGDKGRRLLKPMVLAKLLQAAAIREDEHVLDVGCATGYSAALLARLARSVVAIEQDRPLADAAQQALRAVGAGNVSVVSGPLHEGWPAGGPYDVILLDGASEVPPESLFRQLKDGGRLVGVVGRSPGAKAMLYRSVEGKVSGRPIFDATAPVLPGFVAPLAFVF